MLAFRQKGEPYRGAQVAMVPLYCVPLLAQNLQVAREPLEVEEVKELEEVEPWLQAYVDYNTWNTESSSQRLSSGGSRQ